MAKSLSARKQITLLGVGIAALLGIALWFNHEWNARTEVLMIADEMQALELYSWYEEHYDTGPRPWLLAPRDSGSWKGLHERLAYELASGRLASLEVMMERFQDGSAQTRVMNILLVGVQHGVYERKEVLEFLEEQVRTRPEFEAWFLLTFGRDGTLPQDLRDAEKEVVEELMAEFRRRQGGHGS